MMNNALRSRIAFMRSRVSRIAAHCAAGLLLAGILPLAHADCEYDFELQKYLPVGPAITVALSSPSNGATYNAPASIGLSSVFGNTANEQIVKVEYYANSTLVATAVSSPWSTTWSNVVGGTYSMTAKAYTRCSGAGTPQMRSGTSAAASVSVISSAIPVTSIDLLSNAGLAPAAISLSATVNDTGGTAITKVEFLANGSVIGTVTSPPYTYRWVDAGPGNWNLQAKSTNALGGTYTSTTVNAIVASPPAWPTEASLTKTRTSAFAYDTTTGMLIKEMVEPGNSNLCVVTVYAYDKWGNKQTTTTRNCNGAAAVNSGGTAEAAAPTGDAVFAARSSTTNYDTRGQFVLNASNALSHAETYVHDARFGSVTSQTGPNGLSTSWTYDNWGRKTRETRPDGTYTNWIYTSPCTTPNQNYVPDAPGCYLIGQAEFSSAATQIGVTSWTTFDQLNRKLFTTKGNFAYTDNIVSDQVRFDSLGRVTRAYRPYLRAQWNTPAYTYTENTYDTLGRVTSVYDSASNTTVRTAVYNGLQVDETRYPGNGQAAQVTTTLKNIASQTRQVVDAEGGRVRFAYDAHGNRRSTDSQGVLTSVTYDVRGRKLTMSDADMGNWSYAYNALGELIRQIDANTKTTTMVYDKLGRMTSRTEADLTSTWVYDATTYQSPNCGLSSTKTKGKLVRATTSTNYERITCYDNLGRASGEITKIGSESFRVDTAFDTAGRVSTVSYPASPGVPGGRLVMQNVYRTDSGYLQQVKNVASGAAVWTANEANAFGQVTSENYSNGLSTTRTFDNRGRTYRITTTGGAQDTTATWNDIDTVVQRTWVAGGQTRTENFSYDRLNRLQTASTSGGAVISTTYDLQGNLTSKTGVGTYSYLAGSHRLGSVAGTVNGVANPTFGYDNNGNLKTGAAFSVTPTSFDMPASITKNVAGTNVTDTFSYGSEHQRVKQVAGLVNSTGQGVAGTLTTLYIGGGLFEKETNSTTGLTEYKHYVSAGGRLVTVYIVRSNSTTQWNHHHQDHLGSTVAVTNDSGAVVEAMSFDAWGKRRNLDGSALAGFAMAQNDRGYTGHEQLDNIGLVHMNGRIYDPMLARFMSADPFVQAPDYTQSYNRYMYVVGNPLTLTDPSGYNWISRRWKHDVWQNKYGRLALVIAASYFASTFMADYLLAGSSASPFITVSGGLPTSALPTTLSTLGSATVGAAGGFAGGLVSSGGDLKSAGQGALTGGMFGVVGTWEGAANYAGHAGVGCISASLGGGSCARGALAEVVSKGATNSSQGLNDFSKGVVTTLTGGAVSAITGGKFVDGAQTAAFGYLFNYLPHVHKILTMESARAAGLGLQESDLLSAMAVTVDWQDGSQSVPKAYVHSMCSAGTSSTQCDLQMADYREKLWNMKSGPAAAALIHHIQDSYAPMHQGGQVYSGLPVFSLEALQHAWSDRMPDPATRKIVIQHGTDVIRAYNLNCNGCLSGK
jgi:RHS repeat-associated protein